MGRIPYFLVGQDAAGRKPKPTPCSPQMLLGKQSQARNRRLEGLSRCNHLTKNTGCTRFSEGLGAVSHGRYGMRKCCRRVQLRSARMGVLHAAPRQIAKLIKIPNTAIVTRTPPIQMPISHCMRLLSRCAMSARNLSKAVSFWAMSVRNLSISTRNRSKAPSYFA